MSIPSFDDLMNSSVNSKVGSDGQAVAAKVMKSDYRKMVALGNVTSYSVQQTFHACPRKFQIAKLRADLQPEQERMNNVTFAFGHAVGAGVATFDATQSMDQAIWSAFLAWDMDLLDVETKRDKETGKHFAGALWALFSWREFSNRETDLADYESVNIEATIAVDFEDGHFYVGHIDQLLRNKETGTYRVKENKTTALVNIDPAMYSNSDQGLSYAVVVDMLGGNEYEVMYTVYSANTQEWQQFSFVKSASKKAEWLQDQLLMHQTVDAYAELNFFPKRGNACMGYMRRCSEYETCDLSQVRTYGKRFDELKKATSLDDIRAIEHVDYATTLTEIAHRQRKQIQEKSQTSSPTRVEITQTFEEM